MSLIHRRCGWCADKLRPAQKHYCSRICVQQAWKDRAPSAGAIRWHRRDVQPHGTGAAWRRHYRRGEKPCEACRGWRAREDTDRRSLIARRAS